VAVNGLDARAMLGAVLVALVLGGCDGSGPTPESIDVAAPTETAPADVGPDATILTGPVGDAALDAAVDGPAPVDATPPDR